MLDIPLTKEGMIRAVIETLKRNNLRDAYIRVVVTCGVGDLNLDPRKCPNPTVIIITDTIKLHKTEAKEKGVTSMELLTANEVFFTGTAAEIVPVVEVNKRKIGDGLPGPVTKHFMKEFEK